MIKWRNCLKKNVWPFLKTRFYQTTNVWHRESGMLFGSPVRNPHQFSFYLWGRGVICTMLKLKRKRQCNEIINRMYNSLFWFDNLGKNSHLPRIYLSFSSLFYLHTLQQKKLMSRSTKPHYRWTHKNST